MTVEIKTTAILTCPTCQFAEELKMPTNACQFFHTCSRCQTLLKPKPGDCCVFCSYGDTPCPPIQLNPQKTCGC